MQKTKLKHIVEFGDFQTPNDLARQVLELLNRLGVQPKSIIEPSCGKGAFLCAATNTYPNAELVGVDINHQYIAEAQSRLSSNSNLKLIHASFFDHDWSGLLSAMQSPLLILGNPPWVTSAELGAIGSDNLPIKSNVQNLNGIDALMGKSNFDISEWMLMRNIEWLQKKRGALAVLCKTAVARKIMATAWRKNTPVFDARIYRINAQAHFGAAVDACLFFLQIDGTTDVKECNVYAGLDSNAPAQTIGFLDDSVISNVVQYQRYRNFVGIAKGYQWRSGLKHDCAKVMEFDRRPDGLFNGLGDKVEIEDDCLYPLVKSSDIAGQKTRTHEKWVLVTQARIGDETAAIEKLTPRTWKYLLKHSALLDARASVIYRNKPRFCMFGVGDYTFAPWKIAISGLYKKLSFKLFGPKDGKPLCFDDTVYFLPFDTEEEATNVLQILNDDITLKLLESLIFWDEKRPITVELLKRADIVKIADHLGRRSDLKRSGMKFGSTNLNEQAQPSLF